MEGCSSRLFFCERVVQRCSFSGAAAILHQAKPACCSIHWLAMVLLLLCLGDGLFQSAMVHCVCLQNPCALSFSGLVMHYSGHKSASFFLEVLLRVRDKLLPHFLTFSVNGMAPLNRAGTVSAWSAPSLGYLFTPSNFNFHSFIFSVPAASEAQAYLLFHQWMASLAPSTKLNMRPEFSKLMESQPFIQYHNYLSFFSPPT
jgi:hypothetical protein